MDDLTIELVKDVAIIKTTMAEIKGDLKEHMKNTITNSERITMEREERLKDKSFVRGALWVLGGLVAIAYGLHEAGVI